MPGAGGGGADPGAARLDRLCTGSLIGRIETAAKVPQRELSERLDAALGTDGLFSPLVGLVLRSQLPSWFRPHAEMEAKAAYVSS
jgi:hypothetical protein